MPLQKLHVVAPYDGGVIPTAAAAGILSDPGCHPSMHLGDARSEQNATAKIACGDAPTAVL